MTRFLFKNLNRTQVVMRLVMVLSLLLLLGLWLLYPHTFRALLRRPTDADASGIQLVASHYQEYAGSMAGECLPVYDGATDADYVAFLDDPRFDVDANGVVLQNYRETFDIAQWQYQPYMAAVYGMVGMQAYCQHGDLLGLEIAVRQAKWLVDNAQYQPYAVWLYDFPNSGFAAPSGWWSGLANAVDLAFLVQVYAVTQDAHYLDTATDALEAFDHPIASGGLQALMPDGESIFFEEVAHPASPPSHILNGHIQALFGLAYYADHIGGEPANRLLTLGMDAVRQTMDEFDAGDRTFYSLNPPYPKPVTHYAHPIHIRGLRWLAERTGDPAFTAMADRWEAMTGTEWGLPATN